jgi:hypothetical protein
MLGAVLKWLAFILVGYGLVVVLAWRYQDRLAFPGPRTRLPAPSDVGLADGRRVSVVASDGVRLAGWYLPPAPAGPRPAPGLLWFYGNMETIGGIWPVIVAWKPPEAALLVLDYRGYGESEGDATEPGLYRDGEAAWDFLAAQPDVAADRIAVYGRSLGSVVALHVATVRPARAVVLESAFSSAANMARRHYWYLPRGLVRLELDNVSRARRLTAPLMVVHGEDDRIAPLPMGRAVAEAGRARTFLTIAGAGHNDTYAVGGDRYRDAVLTFLRETLR